MLSKVAYAGSLLACLSLVEAGGPGCTADKDELRKVFAEIERAKGFTGERPLAPRVTSEDEFNINDFRFHHINQSSWYNDCASQTGKPVVDSIKLAVIKICGG